MVSKVSIYYFFFSSCFSPLFSRGGWKLILTVFTAQDCSLLICYSFSSPIDACQSTCFDTGRSSCPRTLSQHCCPGGSCNSFPCHWYSGTRRCSDLQ